MTMPKQGSNTPDAAPLVRCAAKGDRRARERLVDQYARLKYPEPGDPVMLKPDLPYVPFHRQIRGERCRQIGY